MSLTKPAKRALIAEAHHLHPLIIIGNQGLTKAVAAETDRALFDHELIKVRLPGSEDKANKALIAEELAQQVNAECLKIIGNIFILYRKSQKKVGKK